MYDLKAFIELITSAIKIFRFELTYNDQHEKYEVSYNTDPYYAAQERKYIKSALCFRIWRCTEKDHSDWPTVIPKYGSR